VWADKYGSSKRIKTIWITFLQLGVMIGVVSGYGLTAIVIATFQDVGFIYKVFTFFFSFSGELPFILKLLL
jgi:hypothetical protein